MKLNYTCAIAWGMIPMGQDWETQRRQVHRVRSEVGNYGYRVQQSWANPAKKEWQLLQKVARNGTYAGDTPMQIGTLQEVCFFALKLLRFDQSVTLEGNNDAVSQD